MPPVEFVPLLGVRFIAGTRDTHGTHVRDKQSHVKHIARWFAYLRICRIRTIDVNPTGYFNSLCVGCGWRFDLGVDIYISLEIRSFTVIDSDVLTSKDPRHREHRFTLAQR